MNIVFLMDLIKLDNKKCEHKGHLAAFEKVFRNFVSFVVLSIPFLNLKRL